MKKLLLILVGIMMVSVNVYAAEGYVMWHDSEENAYTSDYDGILKASEKQSYKNGAIVGSGNSTITIKNLTTYDMLFSDSWTLVLSGTSTMEALEVSQVDAITISGDGVLKVKSLGLSLADMTNVNDANHKEVIDKYFKGNYSLGSSGDYIVITALDVTTTTTMATTTVSSEEETTTEEVKDEETTTITTSETTEVEETKETINKNNNSTLYMAIGAICAVALIAVFILKLKK